MPFANIINRIIAQFPLVERDLLMIYVASKKPESHTFIVRLRSRCSNDMKMIPPPESKKDAAGFWLTGLMLAVATDDINDLRLDQYVASIVDGAMPHHR